MVDSDWGAIAKSRFNDKIKIDDITSKEQYQERLEGFLRGSDSGKRIINSPHWDNISQVAFDDSGVAEIAERNTGRRQPQEEIKESGARLLARARRFEKNRPARSRIPDERKTSKITRKVTRPNFRLWRKGGYKKTDLRGVDTKMPRIRRVSRAKWRKKR